MNIEDPTLDQHKFAPVMPQLHAILAPLCPHGFKTFVLVLEATQPIAPMPAAAAPAAVYMITDIKDQGMLLDLLTSCCQRLASGVPVH